MQSSVHEVFNLCTILEIFRYILQYVSFGLSTIVYSMCCFTLGSMLIALTFCIPVLIGEMNSINQRTWR